MYTFMNYENLYQSLLPDEKSIKDSLASLQKLQKAIVREMENGDLKYLSRDLNTLAQTAAALSASIERLSDSVNAFDAKAYFENGDFAAQMLELCQEQGVDVKGEFPVYEMFPYRVKLDVENQDVYLDKKRIQCMRPASFLKTVKAGQEKLNKAHFNVDTFVSELEGAYELATVKLNRAPESDIYLTNLYKFLTPMSRFRRDYDLQNFSFDVARLYAKFMEGMTKTKSGKTFAFGPAHNSRKSLRILDANGNEQYLTTIQFMSIPDED